jgi:hypothetical protein
MHIENTLLAVGYSNELEIIGIGLEFELLPFEKALSMGLLVVVEFKYSKQSTLIHHQKQESGPEVGVCLG